MGKPIVTAAALAVVLSSLPAAAPAMTTSAGQIAANPGAYNGRYVEVRGVATQVEQRTFGLDDPYETFLVCASACIPVVAFGWPDVLEGLPIVVRGTFQSVKTVDGVTFRNAISADDDSL